jgi:Lrp/AsnC family transcriptional regulator for asnA, asnC and gidA
MSYEIDSLDRRILSYLLADARTPFLEIARTLKVSGGTIHGRVARLREEGIIKGSKVIVDHEKLGYSVTAFIGITLAKAGSSRTVQGELERIPEIVELHYTTGNYSLFAKIVVPGMRQLYEFLSNKLQTLEDIQSTETFIVLDSSVQRDLTLVQPQDLAPLSAKD